MIKVVLIFILSIFSLSSKALEIKLATYNIHGLPDYISFQSGSRFNTIGTISNDYDIIGFQEIFSKIQIRHLNFFSFHPFKFFFFSKVEDRIYSAGLALFSKFPIIFKKNIYFEDTCTWTDCLAYKGFQIIRINVNGIEIDVYNTHMEAGDRGNDQRIREKQIQLIISAMGYYSKNRPIIFLGDMNCRYYGRDYTTIEMLSNIGFVSSCADYFCNRNIDKILFRNSEHTKFSVKDSIRKNLFDSKGNELSDHFIFGITLEIQNNP